MIRSLGLLGEEGLRAVLGAELETLVANVGPERRIVGWATIDLDRSGPGVEAPDDAILGARARRIDAQRIALEPATEGPLAASLARFGEGPVALYLVGGRAPEGTALSAEADGPLGRQRLLLGGSRWGPHLLLVVAPDADPATITP